MELYNLDEIRILLRDRVAKRVSDRCGIPPSTIIAIQRGESEPTYKTLVRLSRYFQEEEDEVAACR